MSVIDYINSVLQDAISPQKNPLPEMRILEEAVICYQQGFYFASAPTIWMFIEMYLRSILVFNLLEDIPYNPNDPNDKIIKHTEIENNIENNPKTNQIRETLKERIKELDILNEQEMDLMENKFKDFWSFNSISTELENRGKLEKKEKKQLNKYYSKYRNTIQHGKAQDLFHKTINDQGSFNTMGFTILDGKFKSHDMSIPYKSSLLRQSKLTDMYKEACERSFEIVELLLSKFYKLT